MVFSELDTKICEGVKRVGRVDALLVFPVAVLHLAGMPRDVKPDQCVPYPTSCQRRFKERGVVSLAVGKPVGELKTIVGLYTLHRYSSPPEPKDGSLYEVGG